MWIGTLFNGLSCLNLETELFTNYQFDHDTLAALGPQRITALEKTRFNETSEIWMAINGLLLRFNPETEESKIYQSGSRVNSLHYDSEGRLWIGTIRGLGLYEPDSDEIRYFIHDKEDPASIPSGQVTDIQEDSEGVLWVVTWGVLNKANFSDLENGEISFEQITFPGGDDKDMIIEPTSLFEDSKGRFWVDAFRHGLVLFDRKSQSFKQYLHNPDDPHSIGSDHVETMCEDRSGNVWFGHAEGLSKYDDQKTQIQHYEYTDSGSTGLRGRGVTAIQSHYKDKEEILFIGTMGNGLCRLNRTTGETYWFNQSNDESSIPSVKDITTLTLLESEHLLIGGYQGLSLLNITTGLVLPSVDQGFVLDSFHGSSGRTWLSSGAFLRWFSLDSMKVSRYYPENTYASLSILETTLGDQPFLWVGTAWRGLLGIDLTTKDQIWYRHDPENPASIANNQIVALFESELDGKRVLWVGTMGGLDLYDYETKTFTHYTREDGLPHNYVYSVTEDANGQLWISTKLGLSRFDPLEKQFKSFWKDDGLPGDTYEFEPIYHSPNGEIFVGGEEGLISFYPDSLRENTNPPNVVLTQFKLFNELVKVSGDTDDQSGSSFSISKHISYLDELHLTYRENIFSFTFAALDFHSPRKNQYAYFLEGFEDDWNYVDASNREVTYTNIDPGEYIFRVKASNNDGVWNEEGVSLAIVITPPWWQSKIAYSAYFLLVMSTLTLFYKNRLARIRLLHQAEIDHMEAERYHEMDELKSRFFANISHEFRTPLTLILGPVGKMLTKLKGSEYDQDLNLMQRQAKRLLELVTQLLDLSKLEAGSMQIQVSRRNLVPLLKGLTLSFASLAERDKITFTFNTEYEDIQVFVEKDAIAKIMNNLLSNAFKFTRSGGNIQVDITTNGKSDLSNDGELCIAITDSGIGIPDERLDKIFDRFYQIDNSETREREGTGIGLALTRELIELHKGTIGATSTEGKGTTFTVRLPLGTDHLADTDIIGLKDSQLDEVFEDHISSEESAPSLTGLVDEESPPILLIVEDNEDVRNYIRSYLDDQYECHEAVDGEAGLEQAFECIPDLIISDVMMPKMDGVEFCRRIKTEERTSHIPVILLTAKADLESKLEGLETGADEYLTKPFEAEELLVRIKNLIEQRELLRQRFQEDFSLVPKNINLSSMDEQFLEKATGIITDNFQNFNFNVDQLSSQIFMSRQHLNRKLKALTSHTSRGFIRMVRMKSAVQLLRNHQGTVSEISYTVGFNSPSQFTKAFQKEFGATPTAFMAEQKAED